MGVFDGFDSFQGSAVQMDYRVDITMVIDATGSMSPIISEVKQNAMSFCTKFHEAMEASGKNVGGLRIRVLPYRDYGCDGEYAMDNTCPFFNLPEQNDEYRRFVETIEAKGGGDEPESALEALALAMRSPWTSDGGKRRHVILVFSDASAVPLKDPSRTANSTYPSNMPSTLAELGDMWKGCSQSLGGMPDERATRMVLFVPNVSPWTEMQTWNNVWTSFSKAGTGLEDIDIQLAIQLLVASVT